MAFARSSTTSRSRRLADLPATVRVTLAVASDDCPVPVAPGNRVCRLARRRACWRCHPGGFRGQTIVASFDGYPTARRVVRELMDDGYMSRDIGVVASNVSGDYRVAGALEPKDDEPGCDRCVDGWSRRGCSWACGKFLCVSDPRNRTDCRRGPSWWRMLSGAGAGAVAGA